MGMPQEGSCTQSTLRQRDAEGALRTILALRPADNSPFRRHLRGLTIPYTRLPTLPLPYNIPHMPEDCKGRYQQTATGLGISISALLVEPIKEG